MSVAAVARTLEEFTRILTEHPEKARVANVPATARLLDDLRCEVKGPNGEDVRTDMPPAVGGAGSGPAPGWLLRASLASCTATTIAMRAARLGIDLTTLEVTAESASDHRGMLGLDDSISAGLVSITIRVRIGSRATTAAALRELAEWGDRHSAIACTVRHTLDVQVV